MHYIITIVGLIIISGCGLSLNHIVEEIAIAINDCNKDITI